ncbi:MAG TPA: peptidylprolyl isomerase [Longimicrobium sp.]|jgi:parvulin-like peptidyl-prolyl isomerase
MMQLIRSKAGKFMVVVIVGAFLAWMVFTFGMEVTGAGGGRPGELGSVNGQAITLEAYQAKVQQLQEQLRQQGQARLTAEQQKQLEDRAWDELVNDILVQQEMARRGIGVSDDEIRFAALNIPAPQIAQQEIFLTNGQFDINKYRQFLRSQASDQVLNDLEQYYRQVIPQSKLQQQIAAGAWVSDAELWRYWQDQNERVTAEYVALDLSNPRVAPGTVQVGEAEIRRRYEEKKDEFKRPESARFTVAYLPTAVTEADRQATLAKARQLRQQILAGADFAEVARRESRDPQSAPQGGDLGTVTRGQMVAAFDSAVWATPAGQVSEPVQTQYGWHLLQVTERTDSATAKVRHILLPEQKSDEELARLDARADSLETLAENGRIEQAARAVGATLRQGVTVSESLPYIPGVGPALEALQWASGASRDEEAGAHPVSQLFDGEQALYLVRLESYTPAGAMTLAQATPQIREQLILEKKRAAARQVGQQIVAEVRRGATLQQAAARRGLTVGTVGPFTRNEPNTVFGQASAATGAAFGTPVGRVSDVVETPAGLFIVRPTAHTPADRRAFEAEKEQLRSIVTMRVQQEQLARWMDSVRKRSKIKDNRDKVFGRAS